MLSIHYVIQNKDIIVKPTDGYHIPDDNDIKSPHEEFVGEKPFYPSLDFERRMMELVSSAVLFYLHLTESLSLQSSCPDFL